MRAMLKPIEEIDDKFKCCPTAVRGFQNAQGRILNLMEEPFIATKYCVFCETPTTTKWYRFQAGFVPIEMININKGLDIE